MGTKTISIANAKAMWELGIHDASTATATTTSLYLIIIIIIGYNTPVTIH
jgi:hypothetical protein